MPILDQSSWVEPPQETILNIPPSFSINMRLRPTVSASLALSLLCLLVLPTVTTAGPTRTHLCRNRCHLDANTARAECHPHIRSALRRCHVVQCHVANHRTRRGRRDRRRRRGWACAPRPSPVALARGCTDKCYTTWKRAFRDCRYVRRPVSGCTITACRRARGKRMVWACSPSGDSIVDPKPTPSVSSSPHPSSSPNPTPNVPGASFTDLTFRTGRTVDDRTEQATDGSSKRFSISYDMTLTAAGVVSLNALAGSARVSCQTDGSVNIRLDPSVPVTSLQEMYPIGAVLAITRDLFGNCQLTPSTNPSFGEPSNHRTARLASDRSKEFQDALLYIRTVSGSGRNAVIKGVPTTYFALFDKARIEMFPKPETLPPTARNALALAERSRSDLDVTARDVTQQVSKSINSSIYTATATLKLVEDGRFDSFKAEWGLTFLDLELKVTNGWKVEATFDIKVEATVATFRETYDLISVALYGVPSINFFNRFTKFSVPAFKLGFYFEAPLLIKGNVKLGVKLPVTASLSYASARTQITYYARGPYTSPDVGTSSKVITPSKKTFQLTSNPPVTEPVKLLINLFFGVIPSLAVYLPVFQARATVDAGLDLTGTFFFDNILPPCHFRKTETGCL